MEAVLSPPRWPDKPHNLAPSFALALVMHGLLFAGLTIAVRWNVEPQAAAYAELWAPLPPVQAPRPEPKPEPPPPPRIETPPEPAKTEADIALERERKRLEQQKVEEERRRQEEQRRRAEEEARRKAQAERQRKEELARQEAERRAMRDAMEKRILAEAAQTASAEAAGASGVRGASGTDARYSAAVVACIRQHLAFAVPEGTSADVAAEFRVDLLPDASVAAVVLQKRSGLAGYDDAAERAIRRCDPFPRKRDGSVDRTIYVRLRPVETR
jgi:colicin import membrane protein